MTDETRLTASPFGAPWFTQISNYVLDKIMPTLPLPAWAVLCVVLRATWGFVDEEGARKTEDVLSYNQLKARSGIGSYSTIKKAIDVLIERKYITRRPAAQSRPGLFQPPFVYGLNTGWVVGIEELKSRPARPTATETVLDISTATVGVADTATVGVADTDEDTATVAVETKEKVVNRAKKHQQQRDVAVDSDSNQSQIPERQVLKEMRLATSVQRELLKLPHIDGPYLARWLEWMQHGDHAGVRSVSGLAVSAIRNGDEPPAPPVEDDLHGFNEAARRRAAKRDAKWGVANQLDPELQRKLERLSQ